MPPPADEQQQLDGEAAGPGVSGDRPERTPHGELVRQLAAARQQQHTRVAARCHEKERGEQQQEVEEACRLPMVVGSEAGVIDGPDDEAPVAGPGRSHGLRQPIPRQRRQRGGIVARRRAAEPPHGGEPAPGRVRAGRRRRRARAARVPTAGPRGRGRAPGRAARFLATPMTVNGCPPRRTDRPTTAVSRPKWVVQVRCERTSGAVPSGRNLPIAPAGGRAPAAPPVP